MCRILDAYARRPSDYILSTVQDTVAALEDAGITMADIANSPFWYQDPPHFQVREPSTRHWSRKQVFDKLLSIPAVHRSLSNPQQLRNLIYELDTMDTQSRREQAVHETPPETEATAQPTAPGDLAELETLIPTMTNLNSKYVEGMTQAQHRDPTFEAEPLNLALLKQNLEMVRGSRGKFTDPYQRQRRMEESALHSAKVRLQVAKETIDRKAKGAMDLGDRQIQLWMFNWYRAMEKELKSIIGAIGD